MEKLRNLIAKRPVPMAASHLYATSENMEDASRS